MDIVPYTDMTDQPIIGLEIKRFNWRLRKAREALGWSRAELARHANLTPGTVGRAEQLHRISIDAMEKISFALNAGVDDIFPGEIDALLNDGPSKIEISLDAPQLLALTEAEAATPHLAIEEAEHSVLRQDLEAILKTLSPRQREVMELRVGLADGESHSHQEIGDMYGVTRERIRQIETAALRKLRHPSRTRPIRSWLGSPDTYEGTLLYIRREREAGRTLFNNPIPPKPESPHPCNGKGKQACYQKFGPPTPASLDLKRKGKPLVWCTPCWDLECTPAMRRYRSAVNLREQLSARMYARSVPAPGVDEEQEVVDVHSQ